MNQIFTPNSMKRDSADFSTTSHSVVNMLSKQDTPPATTSSPVTGGVETAAMQRTRWCSTTCTTAVSSSTSAPPPLLPQLFPCPPTASAAAILTCSKCFSSSHSHCVVSPQTPYICRLCTDPGAATFRLEILENDGGRRVVLDREAANMLSAAGKIASTSINNAGVAALKADAERKAKGVRGRRWWRSPRVGVLRGKKWNENAI